MPAWHARSIDLDESLKGWDGLVKTTSSGSGIQIWRGPAPQPAGGKARGKSCFDYDSEMTVPTGLCCLDSQPCGRRALMSRGAAYPDGERARHYVPLLQQDEYRYQIIAEGHCSGRTEPRLALCAGPPIMQESSCREFYGLGLEPWVHYVPVDPRLLHGSASACGRATTPTSWRSLGGTCRRTPSRRRAGRVRAGLRRHVSCGTSGPRAR